MKNYYAHSLYVVTLNGHKFICEERFGEFIEVLTKEKIEVSNEKNIEKLGDYYPILALADFTKKDKYGNPLITNHLMLTKKDILLKYVDINKKTYNIKDFDVDDFLSRQKEKIKVFEILQENNPELAKEIATRELQESNILDDSGELKPPYDKVFIKNK